MNFVKSQLSAGLLLLLLFSCSDIKEEKVKVIDPEIDNGGILLPDKFGAVVVADSLGRGRHVVVNDNGDIYVHLRRLTDEGHGIMALRDTTGDGKADILLRNYNTGVNIMWLMDGFTITGQSTVQRVSDTNYQVVP